MPAVGSSSGQDADRVGKRKPGGVVGASSIASAFFVSFFFFFLISVASASLSAHIAPLRSPQRNLRLRVSGHQGERERVVEGFLPPPTPAD